MLPIILYHLRYSDSKEQTLFVSFSAIGLYILYTIAFPIPNSDNDNICKMDMNKLLSPKYSEPNFFIITVLIIKGKRIPIDL